jgi:porin
MLEFKKQRKLRIFIILLLFLSFYSTGLAFANQTENTESWQEITSVTGAEISNIEKQNKILIATSETSAVEKNMPKANKEKNIVPVLELKGGVKEAQQERPSLLKTWLEGDYATGNWFGLRSRLEEHGVSINSSYYNGDWLNLRGGTRSAAHLKALGVIDTSIGLDTKKLGLWSGGKLFARFQNKHGVGSTKDLIGDYQLLDTYDVHRFGQISEYYYEQSLFNDVFKLKAGKQDANYDFCVLNSGFNFANASFSYMPTVPLPSYPNPAMGLVATIKPTSWSSIKSGWYDGEGLGGETGFKALDSRRKSFFIEEIGLTPNIKNHPGNYLIGYWLNTGHVDELTNGDVRTFGQNNGWYLGAEQLILKENNNADDTQGLTMLGQFGWRPSDRNEVSRYWSLGMQYQGFIPKRDNDLVGFAAANAGFSGRLKDIDERYGYESALEMFYKVQLTPWLAIQPDMQIIMHPNGQNKSAFVMGLRTFITF